MESPDQNALEHFDAIGSERRLQLLVKAVRDYATMTPTQLLNGAVEVEAVPRSRW